jgi:hypothetical protein
MTTPEHPAPDLRQAAERCRLLDELIASWRDQGNSPEQMERRIQARSAVEDAWSAPPEQQWIAVGDRLPPPGVEVLAAHKYQGADEWVVSVTMYHPEDVGTPMDFGNKGWLYGSAENVITTHWTPLPVAPGAAPPAQEQAGQIPKIIQHLAEWEDKNGSLCAITADEWAALMEPITQIAVHESPRQARALLSASPVQQEGAAPKGEAFPGAAVPPEQYAQNLLESCANWLETRAQVPQMVSGEAGLMGIYAADLRRIKAYIAATPARADAPIGLAAGAIEEQALTIWRAIGEEAEAVVQGGRKYLLLTEEMRVRLGAALEAIPAPAGQPDTEVIQVPAPERSELLRRADRLARAMRGSRVNYAVEQETAATLFDLIDALAAAPSVGQPEVPR